MDDCQREQTVLSVELRHPDHHRRTHTLSLRALNTARAWLSHQLQIFTRKRMSLATKRSMKRPEIPGIGTSFSKARSRDRFSFRASSGGSENPFRSHTSGLREGQLMTSASVERVTSEHPRKFDFRRMPNYSESWRFPGTHILWLE